MFVASLMATEGVSVIEIIYHLLLLYNYIANSAASQNEAEGTAPVKSRASGPTAGLSPIVRSNYEAI